MNKGVTDRHVGSEACDQRGGDGVRDGGVGVFRLLSCRCDDVEADEGVETGRCSLHHLNGNERKSISQFRSE